MFRYILKRLLLMIVTLFGITIITFIVTRLTPGEPRSPGLEGIQGDSASHDDLVEQNRRNLGLDKPLAFNFEFEDRHTVAEEAVRDFIRPANFWQRDAERRLRLAGVIAVPPVVEMIAKLQTVTEGVDHEFELTPDPREQIDPEAATRRLFEMLPGLAQKRDLPEGYQEWTVDERLSFWKQHVEENQGVWNDETAEERVDRYLEGEITVGRLISLGGYAIPPLIQALKRGDGDTAFRANNGLSALTGYNYLSSPDAWEEEKGQAIQRWKSFYSREKIRFNDPGPVGDFINIFANTQYGVWFGQLLKLDFGDSYTYRRPVTEIMKERLPITLILSFLSIFFSYLIAIPIGIFSAIKRYTKTDKVVTVILFLLYSLPNFWVAVMCLLLFTGGPSPIPGVDWPEIFPARGLNSEGYNWRDGGFRDLVDFTWHLILPTLTLTYTSLAFISRQMRSAMLEVINEDFIRTAHAKGLAARTVIFKHALRNSLIPILTISSGLLPELIAGSIVIESIFSIPGMGFLTFEAILTRDFPVINAVLFFSAALTLIGILIVDLSYAAADPRIKYE